MHEARRGRRPTGWNDPRFAVARNEEFEIGTRRLLPHSPRADRAHVPEALLATHGLVADELDGVIDLVMTLEREVHVEMFHGDEVNEEAVLFANWAYKSLHDAIIPLRHALAVSPAAWLLSLPYARRDPRPDAGRRDHLDGGERHRDLLQGLGNAAGAPLVHLPVPPGADGRHPRHRRPLGPRYQETQESRRRAPADPPALPRHAGVKSPGDGGS